MRRFFEIIPALLSWGTLLLVAALAWKAPMAAAIFIILFDLYWLLKTLYLSLHLRSSFAQMRKNMATQWLEKLKTDPETSHRWRETRHLVILPMYREPYRVVRESIMAIAKTNYPLQHIIVVLAIEARGGEADRETAEKIRAEFGDTFFKFLVTMHPSHLPGEIPGKGSNETWAAQEAKQRIIDAAHIPYEHIIVSVCDADTVVPSEYFGILTYRWLTAPRPARSSFQPVPLFINNLYQAPALARIVAFSSTFWHMMQQQRPEQLTTFSSHAVPFKALVEAGFWNTDTVSEDSQIFWKLFLHYNGDWRVEPLFYPVSMDAACAPTFWKTMVNVYKQQRRWGWGVENIPYMIEGFRKNKNIPGGAKVYWLFKKIEGFHSWATNAFIIFTMGWLPVLLGSNEFQSTLLSHNLPRITGWVMHAAMIGIVTSAILSAALLPPKPAWFRPHHYILYFVQWFLMPLTLIIFGSVPALDAQTRLALGGRFRLGFWATPKFRN